MFEIANEHQFWTAVVIYWMFSAAVSSMPEPGPNGSPAYLWFFRFLHSIAGNITTAFGGKIPGVKTLTVILLIPVLLSASACRAHSGSLVEVHAGQDVRPGSTTEEMLLEIIRTGIRAYEQHTGEPLDPALIRAEAPL